MTPQFANEEFSVRKPAWTSASIRSSTIDKPVSQFVFIQTTHAIYNRAKVIKESSDTVTVEYVKKSSDDKSKIEKKVETIRRSEILVLRSYID